jgi:VWFA-related protein
MIPAWPQAAPAQGPPEIASQETPLTFSTRVNLVSVPVVVRDRTGHAIGTLRKEDFQLFDKGKLQVITKFSVETAAASPPAIQTGTIAPGEKPQGGLRGGVPTLPERYVAYLFDDIHLQSGDLLQTRQAVNRHLDESLEPSARAAIFTTSGQVLSDFTSDREKLRAAVNRVQPFSSGIDRQQSCPYISYYMADLLINKFLYLDGHLLSDQQLMQIMSNGSADRTLVAAYAEAAACMGPCNGGTDSLSSGGAQAQSLGLCQVEALTNLRAAARQALTYGNNETASALGALRDVVRKLSVMPGSRNLVLVSPGFLLTRDHRSDEYDLLDRAIRANVTVNTIDMRGLYTTIPGGDASTPPYHSGAAMIVLERADADEKKEADDVLEELADGTGGAFFHNDNGLKEGLNQLAAPPEYMYVLGYSPDNLKFDGSYHGLKVTLKDGGDFTLRARRGYWAPNRAVDPAEAAREEIREAVFSREELHEIPLEVQTEFSKSSDVKAELTVLAHLNADDLRFRKAEERSNDTLTVVAGLFDENGNYISGIEKVFELHLRDQTLAALQSSGISLQERFSVAPGRYVIRLVVRDAEGQTMAARTAGVEIP